MEEEMFESPSKRRYAVVTGGNKGIGFQICKRLASEGILVILTARSERRGIEAQENLKKHFGHSNNVVFCRLDVVDPASVALFAEFVTSNFGRLDILVNNAGILGSDVKGDTSILEEIIEADAELVFASHETHKEPVQLKSRGALIQTFENAKECLQTNYYAAKRVTEALIPLLKLSDSPRILNVSSLLGNLKLQTNEWAKGVFRTAPDLTEREIDEVVEEFLKSFEQGSLQNHGWPTQLAAYKVSKEALNAYTRIMAERHPGFLINCACPGLCQTDICFNIVSQSTEEGAEYLVKVVVLPHGGSSGCFFFRGEPLFF